VTDAIEKDTATPAAADAARPAPASAPPPDLPQVLHDLTSILQKLARTYEAPPAPRPAPPPPPAFIPVQRAKTRNLPAWPAQAARRPSATRRRLVWLALVLVSSSLVGPGLSLLAPAHGYSIASQSMEPTLHKGTLVYATEGMPEPGDVVVYWSPLANALEVHRVIEVREEDGHTFYLTRGDNNDAADSALVSQGDVRGIVRLALPYMGYLWLVPRFVMAASFFGLVAVYLAIVAWDSTFVRRRLPQTLFAAGIVLLLLAPQAEAAVSPRYAKSTDTLNVATTPLPMSAGTMASATTSDGGNRATVTASAPKLWKEIVMWGCDPTNLASNPGCYITTPNAYAVQTGSNIYVDASDYSPAPTYFLEAYLKAPVAGQSTSVQLYDKTGAAAIGPELTSTSTTLELKRSVGFTLSGAKEYQFQTKDSSAGSSGQVQMVKLLVMQQYPTKTVTQVKVSGAADSTSNGLVDTGRTGHWLYESADYDGTVAVYFEAIANIPAGGSNGAVALVTTAGVALTTLTISATTATRVISAAISPTNNVAYKVQFKDGGNGGGNKITLHEARVVITQSSFTKTTRYEDLTWRHVVSSTTYATVGYPSRYHMDSEWGGLTGYFEGTLVNSNAAQTTTAQLYDDTAAAAVSSSPISNTGTTATRVRSGALTLDVANGTYTVQLKGSGAANAEARSLWLIVKQTSTKTYDYALKATNSIGSCTWSFNAAKTSDSNTARMTSFTISVRGDSSTQNQIVYSGGSYSQTSGSTVTVAASNTAQVLVDTNPASSGTTTVDADLQGTCSGGVKTLQRITFTL